MSFVSLHTALSGIRASRAALDTAAHNVANANTPGFTRQRVDLGTSYPYLSPAGPIGNGVTIDDITRVRDAFLDARLRGDQSRSGELDVRADLLARAEEVLGEPEQGLTTELNELWAAFEELALQPADRATRRQVLSSLDTLASRVNAVAGGFELLEADTTTSLVQRVAEVNGLLDQVASLNGSILDAVSGRGSPNDLLDQRDALIDELSRSIGARATLDDDGTVRVSVAGMAVVEGTRAQHLSVSGTDVVHPAGVAVRTGGEVAGIQRFLADDLPGLVAGLDQLALDLTATLNTQHAAGYTAGGVAGGALLAATSALTLSPVISDPDDLAAAAGVAGAPHDGGNASALAALRTTSGLDGSIRSMVTELAAAVQATDRQARGQRQLTAAAATAREGMHGVSIDEEMVAMLNHQRALEASSRMMSAVDQALDTIINRTGLVGR